MVDLQVNGRAVLVHDADMPLLLAIREDLGLKGTKYGCGKGLCGACTVHLDGVAVRSCVMPTSAAAGRQITTIEGLEARGGPPVQAAWLALDVVQCGYCQPGMLMSASALLARTPQPTDADIDGAVTNLCRCGTYHRVREAIHLAAKGPVAIAQAARRAL